MSAPAESLRARTLRGSAWTLAGIVARQGMRFAVNLILARLLFPEAFGLVAVVWIFLEGLRMFSDLGIGPSIVREPRGEETAFQNTAWTIQVLRGVVLWLGAVALAWPLALFYEEPALLPLLLAASVTVLVAGFQSTTLFVLERHIRLGALETMTFYTRAIANVGVIAWAFLVPSVWALVAGGIATAVLRAVLSYRLMPGSRNWFQWDRDAARAILSFGKWIFFSSAALFIGRQLDRLVVGKLLGFGVLGVYHIAAMLAEQIGVALLRICQRVLYPAFSHIHRDEPDRLREIYYRVRLRLDLLLMPPVGVLIVAAPLLIEVLFDERYVEAGWMLQVLCVRTAMAAALRPCEVALLALGKPNYALAQNATRTVWVALAIPVGWSLAGLPGLVWAAALSELPVLCVLWIGFHRSGLLLVHREIVAPTLLAVGVATGWILEPLARSWWV